MTPLQAKAVIVLFESGHFNTADIADLLLAAEADVVRLLQAQRDIVREMYRDHGAVREAAP
jgi:hypothetical protein